MGHCWNYLQAGVWPATGLPRLEECGRPALPGTRRCADCGPEPPMVCRVCGIEIEFGGTCREHSPPITVRDTEEGHWSSARKRYED